MGEHTEHFGQAESTDRSSLWDDSEDLTALTVEELRVQLQELSAQEKEVSYRRRVLQGRIDLIRAEIVRKGQASLSPEDLARILLDSRGDIQEGRDGEPSQGSQGGGK